MYSNSRKHRKANTNSSKSVFLLSRIQKSEYKNVWICIPDCENSKKRIQNNPNSYSQSDKSQKKNIFSLNFLQKCILFHNTSL